jgi:hypothetical protein
MGTDAEDDSAVVDMVAREFVIPTLDDTPAHIAGSDIVVAMRVKRGAGACRI